MSDVQNADRRESELGRLIEAYRAAQTYPPADAAIARRLHVSKSTVGNWLRGGGGRLPEVDHLRRLATLTGVPYLRVLDAALSDAGYLPKERGGDGNAAPIVTEPAPEPQPAGEPDARGGAGRQRSNSGQAVTRRDHGPTRGGARRSGGTNREDT